MRNAWLAPLLTWLVAFVAGGVFGVAGTIAHAFTWGVLPVGLVLATAGCAGLLVSLRLLTDDRWSALAAGLGMLAALLVYSGRGPGGSVVVPVPAEGDFPFGYVWTYLLAGLVLVAVAWPDVSTSRRLSESGRGASWEDAR
ncbi:histidinol dehydrogenase [Microbacterium betulae]|uniref:Histidinol dehydrogenase n=1 Tax=Microbacterium betulae TaxID=2981139 RepID=A0AA97I896_9MICO|nr:histidinol dehydrogenase [Microbacterium sp. AB]WOF24437.1 histidinol dehydrogenase [Microbacterium sp. AB]